LEDNSVLDSSWSMVTRDQGSKSEAITPRLGRLRLEKNFSAKVREVKAEKNFLAKVRLG